MTLKIISIRVISQHAVLRKKMHEFCMRYLASDVQADVLAGLGLQQRNCSTSDFHTVELDREKVNTLCTRRLTRHFILSTGCLANIAVLLSSFA